MLGGLNTWRDASIQALPRADHRRGSVFTLRRTYPDADPVSNLPESHWSSAPCYRPARGTDAAHPRFLARDHRSTAPWNSNLLLEASTYNAWRKKPAIIPGGSIHPDGTAEATVRSRFFTRSLWTPPPIHPPPRKPRRSFVPASGRTDARAVRGVEPFTFDPSETAITVPAVGGSSPCVPAPG